MRIIKTILWETDIFIPVMNLWNESTDLKFNDVVRVAECAGSPLAAQRRPNAKLL